MKWNVWKYKYMCINLKSCNIILFMIVNNFRINVLFKFRKNIVKLMNE